VLYLQVDVLGVSLEENGFQQRVGQERG
jgi:hypothetical protein